MMRFFWTTFLPLSAAGGAAALLLWLARPGAAALCKNSMERARFNGGTVSVCIAASRICAARRVECSRAGGAKLCGGGSAAETAASEPLSVATELPTAADKLLRAAPQEHISMLWGLVPAFWLAGVLCAALALWAEYRRFTRHLAREARPVEDVAVWRCMGTCRKGRWLFPARGAVCMRRLGNACCGRSAAPAHLPARRTGPRVKRWSTLCDMNACICAGGILCTSWRRRLCVLYIGSIRPRGCCGV